jgi:hypothetical protein
MEGPFVADLFFQPTSTGAGSVSKKCPGNEHFELSGAIFQENIGFLTAIIIKSSELFQGIWP